VRRFREEGISSRHSSSLRSSLSEDVEWSLGIIAQFSWLERIVSFSPNIVDLSCSLHDSSWTYGKRDKHGLPLIKEFSDLRLPAVVFGDLELLIGIDALAKIEARLELITRRSIAAESVLEVSHKIGEMKLPISRDL
jgi:hypothetical protein